MLPFLVSPMDYGTVAASLIFEVCETRRCVNISIEDDMTLENIESFNVILERSPGLDSRIRLDPVIGVVRIIDNDSMFTHWDGVLSDRVYTERQ